MAWKARVILFVGFAFMAGGLAGSVTVLVLKYLVHHYPFPTLQFGVSNVIANALVMLRYQLPRPPLPAFPMYFGVLLAGHFRGVLMLVRWCCGLRRILRRMSISIIYKFRCLGYRFSDVAGMEWGVVGMDGFCHSISNSSFTIPPVSLKRPGRCKHRGVEKGETGSQFMMACNYIGKSLKATW